MKKKKEIHRNKDEKLELILKTFAELVSENGYNNVSTRHVAEKAQISVGTIYRYFPKGMPSIASGIYDVTFDKILDLNQFKEHKIDNPVKMFEMMITNHLRTHKEQSELYKSFDFAMMTNHELFDDKEKKLRELMEESVNKLRRLEFLKMVPQEKMLKDSMLIFSVLEAIIHRHLFITPLFEMDQDLIKFLTKFVLFIIQAQD